MNKDSRISTGFFKNLKTMKLQDALGNDGLITLIKLWSYTATHRCTGVLYDMNERDIEIVCEWPGESGEFVNACLALKWLERDEAGSLCVHDWPYWNDHCASAPERSAHFKGLANKRWEKEMRYAMRKAIRHVMRHAMHLTNPPLTSQKKHQKPQWKNQGKTQMLL